jgi:hypothetical protein
LVKRIAGHVPTQSPFIYAQDRLVAGLSEGAKGAFGEEGANLTAPALVDAKMQRGL